MNAIILAGGRGSRLAPWHAPKSLILIGGVGILHHILLHLHVSGCVKKTIICTGYRASDIVASVEAHDTEGQVIVFSDAGEDTPMGERMLRAAHRNAEAEGVVTERFLILYGDELADVDIAALVAKHESSSAKMTFAVTATPMPGGTLELTTRGQCIINEHATRVVNIGFVVVEPECWAFLKPEDGLSDWINRMGDDAHAYYHTGKRATVNSLADLEYAEQVWK